MVLLVIALTTPAFAERWQAIADGIAAERNMKVVEAGTATLDDVRGADDYALLVEIPPAGDVWAPGAAYLLRAGGRVWILTYEAGGRTQPWTPKPTDRWITHFEGHSGGFTETLFGIRHGRPVVFRERYLEDARAGDKPRTKRFCSTKPSAPRRACPALDTLGYFVVAQVED